MTTNVPLRKRPPHWKQFGAPSLIRDSYSKTTNTTSMRKVQSLGSVNIKGIWSNSSSQKGKASKFSSCANRTRLPLSGTVEPNYKHNIHSSETSAYSKKPTILEHTELQATLAISESLHPAGPPSASPSISRSASVTSFVVDVDQASNSVRHLRTIFQGRSIQSILHKMMFLYLLIATLGNMTQRSSASTSTNQSRMATPTPTLAPSKGTLGSAMIASVTHALAPILPFAGGVDLRRDGEWLQWRSWVQHLVLDRSGDYRDDPTVESSASSMVRQIPRGGGLQQSDKRRVAASAPRIAAISATEPFVSTGDIEQMTLEDISFAFEYAVHAGRQGFDSSTFAKEGYRDEPLSDQMVKIQRAIDEVTQQSRGAGVEPADTAPLLLHQDKGTADNKELSLSLGGFGDMDALQFCAAMRLLAEWRVLRQVPPGYKGYAVGMGLGQKDVVQNVAKMEDAVHSWIQECADDLALEKEMIAREQEKECLQEENECPALKNQAYPPRSPTLRQLLQHEVDINIHPNHKLPRLREKTAAMGLLWVRRQLQYQTSIFDNVSSVPDVFPTMVGAVGAAYAEVYGDFHGWAVQKIFNYSFQSAPDAHEIFRFMNPKRLEEVRMVVQNGGIGSSTLKADVSTGASLTESSEGTLLVFEKQEEIVLTVSNNPTDVESLERANVVFSQFEQKKGDKHPLLRLGDHVGSELDKLGEEIEKISRHIGSELEKAGSHIENEWNKAICGMINAFNRDDISEYEEQHCSFKGTDQHGSYFTKSTNDSSNFQSNRSNQISNEEMEDYITKQMETDAKSHIDTYLKIAHPVLTELAGLFAEMNMDDPTKV